MLDNEWICRATAQVLRYATDMHRDDASALAEDLQRSWPRLPPADAVRFFFQPLQPQSPSGTIELT